jgi:two-component system sensor histidine kinase/response regulator
MIKTKIRVLVVEDDPISQKAVKFMLTDFGYDVDIASNGGQALRMFENNYDMMILDVGLPDISGLEVSQKIRKKEINKRIPIIGWTSQDTMRQACLAAGYDEVVVKSTDFGEFEGLLRIYLAK